MAAEAVEAEAGFVSGAVEAEDVAFSAGFTGDLAGVCGAVGLIVEAGTV